jgi:NAD(P)-dependent dehydrogenase (short-subunit alcohol dehydrogenase family)
VLRLDVAVPFRMVQALLPLLEAAGTHGAPARVVNIGSVDGHAVGTFDNFAYSAGKAGLHQMTRVLAHRLGPRHITVNALAPGPVMTKMTAELLRGSGTAVVDANPLGRLAEAADIGGALIYLSSAAGSYVTGVVLAIDGGFSLGSWSSIQL